ncbi:hypothetical protein AB0J57_32315 [Streptomyces sp. NPDC049837]|uniref:hypothetical protein n=1 Tax=Streptomyces sp. NPDC049837 TaxID=3155277 RepID=UPI00344A1554
MAAAVARHHHTVMGTLVYPEPHHRAAALLHCLARVPALEHSNELFAAMVAAAYLQVSGHLIKVSTDDAANLVAAVAEGRLTIRDTAAAVKTSAGRNCEPRHLPATLHREVADHQGVTAGRSGRRHPHRPAQPAGNPHGGAGPGARWVRCRAGGRLSAVRGGAAQGPVAAAAPAGPPGLRRRRR